MVTCLPLRALALEPLSGHSRRIAAANCRRHQNCLGPVRGKHTVADIVVSGGGLVGAACAASLAKLDVTQRKKILLLESSPKREIQLGESFSNRVSALAPSSLALLDRLGAGQLIRSSRHNNIQSMKVWEACSEACITFANEDGQPLSFLVENDLTQMALDGALQTCCNKNLDVVYGCRVKEYILPAGDREDLPEEGVLVRLENGDTIETQLLVGADGNRSLVRSSLGGESMSWEYDAMGVVGTLELQTELSNNNTAFQRFLPTGPIALLPLNSKFSSLVWSLPTKQAKEKTSLPEKDFLESLESSLLSQDEVNPLAGSATQTLDMILKAFSNSATANLPEQPPKFKGVQNRACFPLGFIHSTRYVGPRTVLVGDAAHRVHPLAGQGVNLGYGDVEALTRAVQGSITDGAGLGHRAYLLQYETERQRHNVPTMLAIDSLQKLYSTTLTPVVLARSLGLQLTNSIPPLKRMMMAHAS